jgi:hypothetical protein
VKQMVAVICDVQHLFVYYRTEHYVMYNILILFCQNCFESSLLLRLYWCKDITFKYCMHLLFEGLYYYWFVVEFHFLS